MCSWSIAASQQAPSRFLGLLPHGPLRCRWQDAVTKLHFANCHSGFGVLCWWPLAGLHV